MMVSILTFLLLQILVNRAVSSINDLLKLTLSLTCRIVLNKPVVTLHRNKISHTPLNQNFTLRQGNRKG